MRLAQIGIIVAFVASGCSVEVLHDIDEGQANDIVDQLHRRGIEADKVRITRGNSTSYTLRVSRRDAPRAWRLLRQNNLPRPHRRGLGETFGDVGLVPTVTQEQALMRHALAGELERSLESIDGVVQARVHVVLPEKRAPFASASAKTTTARAAVLLVTRNPAPIKEEAVRQLVSGSVDQLDSDRVNVVITQTQQAMIAGATDMANLSVVGPFRVARSSRGALLATLIIATLVLMVLIMATVVLYRKNREFLQQIARHKVAERDSSSFDTDASLSLIARSLGTQDS